MEDQGIMCPIVRGMPVDAQEDDMVVPGGDFVFHAAVQPQGGLVQEKRPFISGFQPQPGEPVTVSGGDLPTDSLVAFTQDRNADPSGGPDDRPGTGGVLNGEHHQRRVHGDPDGERGGDQALGLAINDRAEGSDSRGVAGEGLA